MNHYTINFTNRVTPETISIKYKVILDQPEDHKSITQFGSTSFQRFASPDDFFKTGEPAIEMIQQIVSSMDAQKYQLHEINFASSQDEAILGVPSKEAILASINQNADQPIDIKVEHKLLLG